MSQALGAVKSTNAAKIGGSDGSVGRAIRHDGVAPRRIAAPAPAARRGEDCRYSYELLLIERRISMMAPVGSAPARRPKRRGGAPRQEFDPLGQIMFCRAASSNATGTALDNHAA
jgi:hypothetical protein